MRTLLVSLLFVASILNAQKITTFDVPGGVSTQPVAISPSGEIIGSYGVPRTGMVRGFLRDRDGRFTTFDVGGMYTTPTAINSAGQITGTYEQYPILASFLRQRNGEIVTFTLPGVTYMQATVIDDKGQIAGLMRNTSGLGYVVFLRSPDGDITTFDITGAGFVWPVAVNARGQMVGYWPDENQGSEGGQNGFLRQPDGTIVDLDVPDIFPTSTQALAINARGQIAGTYEFICPDPLRPGGENCTTDYHGFLRESDGSYLTFNFPDALETYSVGIDSRGEIVGSYVGTDRHSHGFLRQKDGSFLSFDTHAPNATDTYVEAVNAGGQTTGVYVDAVSSHGFVVTLPNVRDGNVQ